MGMSSSGSAGRLSGSVVMRDDRLIVGSPAWLCPQRKQGRIPLLALIEVAPIDCSPTIQHLHFRPEGPFLSAQAVRPGTGFQHSLRPERGLFLKMPEQIGVQQVDSSRAATVRHSALETSWY